MKSQRKQWMQKCKAVSEVQFSHSASNTAGEWENWKQLHMLSCRQVVQSQYEFQCMKFFLIRKKVFEEHACI